MKRNGFNLVTMILAVIVIAQIIASAPVQAGQVYDRVTNISLSTAGAATWTNNSRYAAIALKRLWIFGDQYATNVITVVRVLPGATTQTVGTITCAGGEGSTASFTAGYLLQGDKLLFSSWFGTNSTGGSIEYEVQEH
jgi:hypothetical protein